MTLEGYKGLFPKMEVLNQKLCTSSTMQEYSNKVVFLLCTDCRQEHFVGDCTE